MKADLKTMTRKQLERLRGDIDKALEQLAEKEKKDALRAAERAAFAHGFTLAELAGIDSSPAKAKAKANKPKKVDGRNVVAPKYRNPENSAETWTGRGRKPKWVEAFLSTGGTLDDITI